MKCVSLILPIVLSIIKIIMSRNEKTTAALSEKIKQLSSRVEQAIEEASETKLTLRTVQGLYDASQNERTEMKNLLSAFGIEYVPGKTRLTYPEYRKINKVADEAIDKIATKMTIDITSLKRKHDEMEKSLGTVREISARLSTTVQPQQRPMMYTSLVLARKSAKKDQDETDDESVEPTGKSVKLN